MILKKTAFTDIGCLLFLKRFKHYNCRHFEWSPFGLTCFESCGGMRNLQTLMLIVFSRHQCLEVSHSAVTPNLEAVVGVFTDH